MVQTVPHPNSACRSEGDTQSSELSSCDINTVQATAEQFIRQLYGCDARSAIANRYVESDWRAWRVTLIFDDIEFVAILDREGNWAIFKNDAKSIAALDPNDPDSLMRRGYRVTVDGSISERRFLRNGRHSLTREEAAEVDLGPYDPEL